MSRKERVLSALQSGLDEWGSAVINSEDGQKKRKGKGKETIFYRLQFIKLMIAMLFWLIVV